MAKRRTKRAGTQALPPLVLRRKIVCDGLEVRGALDVDGVNEQGQPFGRLHFSGNELSIVGLGGDTPKLRLGSAAEGSALGAISFNWVRPDGRQEEVFLMIGALAEDAPASLGGQFGIYCRRKNAEGDGAMKRVGMISPAYTVDGDPRVYWTPALGKFLRKAIRQRLRPKKRATMKTGRRRG